MTLCKLFPFLPYRAIGLHNTSSIYATQISLHEFFTSHLSRNIREKPKFSKYATDFSCRHSQCRLSWSDPRCLLIFCTGRRPTVLSSLRNVAADIWVKKSFPLDQHLISSLCLRFPLPSPLLSSSASHSLSISLSPCLSTSPSPSL